MNSAIATPKATTTAKTEEGEKENRDGGSVSPQLLVVDIDGEEENVAASSDAEPDVDDAEAVVVTGGKFTSYAQFERLFEAWKRREFHPFRVASSETLKQSDGSTNELFKYRYIVFHCAHYGQPRMRGVGKRPNQSYLPCGCRAMLRLNYSWADNHLRITTLNEVHTGHEVDMASFQRFSCKIRRSMNTSSSSSVQLDSDGQRSPMSTASSSPRSRVNSFGAGATNILAAASRAQNTAALLAQPTPLAFKPPMLTAQQLLHGALMSSTQAWAPPPMPSMVQQGGVSAFVDVPQPPRPSLATIAAIAAGQRMMQQRALMSSSMSMQSAPIDLSGRRTSSTSNKENDARHAAKHAVVQRSTVVRSLLDGIKEQLLTCSDADFGSRVQQMRIVAGSWRPHEDIKPEMKTTARKVFGQINN